MQYAAATTSHQKGHSLHTLMSVAPALASVASSIAGAGDTPVEPLAPTCWQGAPSGGSNDEEVWITSQETHRLFILGGHGTLVDTVQLRAGAAPHIITFPPSGKFAYVSGMGDGNLYVLDADSRQVMYTLGLGPTGTHQAQPSPDGVLLLVAQIATQTLVKVAVDEVTQAWTVAGSLSFAPLDKSPLCTVFRDDGQRAYVSLLPSGIAIVDVPTMTLRGTLATDGVVACGKIKSHNGSTVTIASRGGGGHIYWLDMATDAIADVGPLGAADWHSFHMRPNEQVAKQGWVSYVDLFPPTPFNPAHCAGCAVYGVTVRP